MNHSIFYYYLKLLRPRQWLKNFALLAAPMFGGQLFLPEIMTPIFWGFIAFCLLSSSTYVINDLLDVEKDKLHPFKKNRPIASGVISPKAGIIYFIILISLSLYISFNTSVLFFLIAILYLILQLSYSLVFKNLVIFDILIIASGYFLRVYAGEIISGYHISIWLLLTTVSISLFLAVGKRRSELTLLKDKTGNHLAAVRKSLSHYSESLLDAYSMMFAASTLIFYALFTFQESTRGIQAPDIFLPEFLPDYLQRKWLMLTTFPVIYGVMRYLQDIHEKSEGESPERVLLSDKALLSAVLLWGVMVVFIIYVIG